ncbi:hypothetical protein T08_5628 [Trichinella sp. T8]|nr:hypothetical protein T08_5628 [Trichinella sp. T8]
MGDTKKKCRQYSIEYLKYGSILSLKTRSYQRLLQHFRQVHENKAKKDLYYFQSLRDEFHARPTLATMFSPATQNESLLQLWFCIPCAQASNGHNQENSFNPHILLRVKLSYSYYYISAENWNSFRATILVAMNLVSSVMLWVNMTDIDTDMMEVNYQISLILSLRPSTSELILPAEEFSDMEEDILEIKDAPELSSDY